MILCRNCKHNRPTKIMLVSSVHAFIAPIVALLELYTTVLKDNTHVLFAMSVMTVIATWHHIEYTSGSIITTWR